MKHIIVGVLTVFILFLMGYTYKQGRAFHGGEAGKVVEDLKSFEQKNKNQNSFAAPDDSNQENDALKALKDKAGNIGAFKVSKLYKSKCSSCHGVDGNGIIGPKLFGQTSQAILGKLKDYKAGRLESTVMKGLLIGLEDEQLIELANEIGTFKDKVK